MVSGWYDGFPATLLNKYHNIQVHRAKIASLPKVKAYYASKRAALRRRRLLMGLLGLLGLLMATVYNHAQGAQLTPILITATYP
jgi:hypothetical protein